MPLIVEWLTPALDHFIRRELRAASAPPPHPYLPFMEGYINLERPLSPGGGRKIALKTATVKTLQMRLARVRERADAGKEATTLRKLIEGMQELQDEYPRLTV
jgi:hypothetical protein